METPYEQRMREQAEAEGKPWQQNESLKPKSEEEIATEKQSIERLYREKYAAALNVETVSLTQLMERLSKMPKLEALSDKLILSAAQLKNIQIKSSDIPFTNDLIASVIRV
jgi:hypothetical protein